MECVAVFLLLVTAFLAAAIALGRRIQNRQRRRQLFQQLAKQFAGSYVAGGLFSPPKVRLRYGETAAVVSECRAHGREHHPALQVRVAWPHTHMCCEVFAAENHRHAEMRYSWPRIPVEHTELPINYVLTGFDEKGIRQLLSAGVCWQLERLRRLGHRHRLYVLILDGQIVVQKPWTRPRGDEPAKFVQGVLELYDQCMLATVSGIEFLHTEQAQTLDHATCKICGETMTEELVYCRRCKTPHHQECWEYTGVCSVFGCRETVYLLPSDGQLLPRDGHPRPTNKPR
jgi:hypothetical protein